MRPAGNPRSPYLTVRFRSARRAGASDFRSGTCRSERRARLTGLLDAKSTDPSGGRIPGARGGSVHQLKAERGGIREEPCHSASEETGTGQRGGDCHIPVCGLNRVLQEHGKSIEKWSGRGWT